MSHRYLDVVQIWRFILPVPPGCLPKWPRIAYDISMQNESATFAWITRPRDWVMRPTDPLSIHYVGGTLAFSARRDCVVSNIRIANSVGHVLHRVKRPQVNLLAKDVFSITALVLVLQGEKQ